MIISIILSILQGLIIPGLCILIYFKKSIRNFTLLEVIIISTPLSIIINYFLVCSLYLLNLYDKKIILFIIIVEFIYLTYFLFDILKININKIFHLKQFELGSIDIIGKFLFVISAVALLIFFRNDNFNVFTQWDAVISFNRWAKDWVYHSVKGTWGYPQGLPILYSLVYKISETTNIQNYSKLVACYFPFYALLCFYSIGIYKKQLFLACSFGSVIYVFLNASFVYPAFIFSGYTDPVMSALGVFVLYSCIKVFSKKLSVTESSILIISISSIAFIKQTGLIVSVLYIIFYIYINKNKLLSFNIIIKFSLLILFIISIHWYLFSLIYWNDFAHAAGLLNDNILLRQILAYERFIYPTGFGIISLMLISASTSLLSRILILFFILPLYIFWSVWVSYDLRTAYILIPFISLGAGLGLSFLFQRLFVGFLLILLLLFYKITNYSHNLIELTDIAIKSTKIFIIFVIISLILNKQKIQIKNKLISYYMLPVLILIIIFMLMTIKKYDFEYIMSQNNEKRLGTNDLGFNQKINSLALNNSGKFISSLATLYNLPALDNRFISESDSNEWVTKKWLLDQEIKFYIYDSNNNIFNIDNVKSLISYHKLTYTCENLGSGFYLFTKN